MAKQRRIVTGERAEVSQFAQGLNDDYLYCRNLGHAWRPLRAEWKQQERAYYVAYLCTRCSSERSQWLDQYGVIVSGAYHYPEGYTHKHQGRITSEGRAEMRLEQLGRVLGQASKREL